MPTCETCGGHVTERFRAVFDDNDGAVYACSACATNRSLFNGEGTIETETDHNEPAAGHRRSRSRSTTATGSDWRSESGSG